MSRPVSREYQIAEVARCCDDFPYFIEHYAQLYDATLSDWIPFTLWPAQREVCAALEHERLVIILKARQLGMTWLCLGYILWLTIFRPAATVLIFCRGDREAVYLAGEERLRGMWRRLPPYLIHDLRVTENSDHTWALSNGSIVRALPATAGDSFTVTYCMVDEADLCPSLNALMRRSKPTIDGGGRMTLLSRVDKAKPQSEFKNIYRAAVKGENDWRPVFLPWDARPARDAAWYEAQARDVQSRTGSLDDLWEQYPATAEQALRPRQLDKRMAAAWFEACATVTAPAALEAADPAIPGLRAFVRPLRNHAYVIGADPGEGNPGSDPSALCVLDVATGEQVATFNVAVQITTFANYLDLIGKWYNNAALLVERNNHGHAVLLWLTEHSYLRLLTGHDGKPGWLSSALGKTLLYNAMADALRNAEVRLRDFEAVTQLQSIEGASLRAPDGEHDDLADACALACAGRAQATPLNFDAIGGYGKRRANPFTPPA